MLRVVWKKEEEKEVEEVEKMMMIALLVIWKKQFAFRSNWCVYEDSKQLLSRSLHDIERDELH